jgi:hypothetical protein
VNPASINNHMLDEEPRLFFVHDWANDAVKLSPGLRSALGNMNVKPAGA